MKFIKMLKQVIAVSYRDSLIYIGTVLSAGLFGTILMLIIINITKGTQDYGTLGAILSLGGGMIFYILVGMFGLASTFSNAILMGRVRKRYILAQICVNISNTIIFLLSVFLISSLENLIYRTFYPNYSFPINIDFLFENPILLVSVVIFFPLACMTLGTFFIKFSTKFVWVCWGMWMLLWIGGPRIYSAVEKDPNSLVGKVSLCIIESVNSLSAFGSMGALGLIGISSLLLGLIIFIMLRKQRAIF